MYKPSDKTTWNGRTDAHDGLLGLRWHQVVEMVDLSREVTEGNRNFVFLGFSCDEGVRRNQGRVGAAGGPAAIRQAMSNFADHFPEDVQLYGGGDVICGNQRMEEAQAQLGRKVEMLLRKGYRPIVIGGGHETAYGHFLGIHPHLKPGEKLGIINFDAHFDLRSYAYGTTSGTPFLQIADDLEAAGQEFHYLCLGIQEAGNTRKLYQTAQERGTTYISAQSLLYGDAAANQEHLRRFMDSVDQLYLSIDLDVFATAYAPGVSSPTALGLNPQVVLPLLQQVMGSGKVMSLDVVELNPVVDLGGQTARLAAALIYQLIQTWK
jgi:formiminoglutamase